MYNITINKKLRYQHWNLDDIYPLDKFENEKSKLHKELNKLLSYWSNINPKTSSKDFAKFIESRENTIDFASRLIGRLELDLSVNQKDAHLRKLRDLAIDQVTNVNNKLFDIERWLSGLLVEGKDTLDPKNANRLFKSVPNLKYYLTRKRGTAKYFLNNREEKIVDSKDVTGLNSLLGLRDLITNDYRFDLKIGNETQSSVKSASDLMSLTFNPDRQVRTLAYKLFLNKYKSDIDKHFIVYQSVVKDWCFEAELRGHKKPISVRNYDNDISDETVNLLLDITSEKKKIFKPFFQHRAKQLGVKKMNLFDIHAPIDTKEINIDFNQAKEIILEVFGSFGPRFHNYAKQVFELGHVDYLPSPDKQNVAYCENVGQSVVPYVFINYNNKISDVFALAHEIGHAVHSLYSSHLPHSVQEACIPLSETASTMAEMMVFEYILKQETDTKTKDALITGKLTETYEMIIRKIYLVAFELKAYQEIAVGTDPEGLSRLFLDTVKEQCGNDVEVDPIFRYEWASIKHLFEVPFYCYAYNFGELLSYSLYARYKQEGNTFFPKIEKILSIGGSIDPKTVLKEIGININSREMWLNSFKTIEDLIKSLVTNTH